MRVAPFGCHKRRNVAFGQSPVTSTCAAPRRSDIGPRMKEEGREERSGTPDVVLNWGDWFAGQFRNFPLRRTYARPRKKRDTERICDKRAITRTELGIVALKNSIFDTGSDN